MTIYIRASLTKTSNKEILLQDYLEILNRQIQNIWKYFLKKYYMHSDAFSGFKSLNTLKEGNKLKVYIFLEARDVRF